MRERRLLQDDLLASAAARPEQEALAVDGTRISYGELLESSLRVAYAFQQLGMQRGDRVVVFTDNSLPGVLSVFGALLAGGVFVVVNPQTKADKLAYILNDSEAALLVTEGSIARIAAEAKAEAPLLKATICASCPDGVGETAQFEDLVSSGAQSPRDTGVIAVDLAALIYTSGSTGLPKGVMMTHQSMLFTAGSVSEYLRLECEHRILNVLPLAFDYGLYQLLMSVHVSATLVLERSFVFPAQVLKRLEEERATVFPGVPTVFATLVSMHERNALHLPSVERVTNTAAA